MADFAVCIMFLFFGGKGGERRGGFREGGGAEGRRGKEGGRR